MYFYFKFITKNTMKKDPHMLIFYMFVAIYNTEMLQYASFCTLIEI